MPQTIIVGNITIIMYDNIKTQHREGGVVSAANAVKKNTACARVLEADGHCAEGEGEDED